MHYIRIYADESGLSHLEDVEVELASADFAPPAPPLAVGVPIPVTQAQFFTLPVGWHGDWHPTPRRQFYVQTQGELEIEVGDGAIRRLRGGAVALLEDVAGPGHVSRVIGDQPVTGVFIQ